MTMGWRAITFASLASLLAGCASVPRDSGFADVRQAVMTETRQPVDWNPREDVRPPDDAAVAALLDDELTADRAVQIAFANNRDLQATLEELGLARAELIGASTIRNPLFDGEVRFPGDPRSPFELAFSQTLIDIFQLGNRKKLGRAQFEAAKVRVSGAAINFAGQVRMDYYDALAARKILARQEAIMKAQEAATEVAKRQHFAGNISDLDLENEQSRYEQVKLDLSRAQLDELQARERLIADLGLIRRAELKLPDDFPAPPDFEMPSEEVEQEVVSRRLDLRIAQREIEAAQSAMRISRTAAFEDLAVGVHLEREPDGKKTTGPAATIPIPIFDRGAAAKARARAMLRQAQQRFGAMNVAARSEARAAQERLLEARSRMDYLRDVVIPRRERILRLTQLEYNAMLRGVFQLIDARKNLDGARREEVIATRDYWVARTELQTALSGVGRFSIRPEAVETRRLDFAAPLSQQETKTNENE
ncbi:MAG TPA: TolC family protein [Vicinamibacteria bacterium]|nr:TolC family protein [Vicinamibacteria bacterium]